MNEGLKDMVGVAGGENYSGGHGGSLLWMSVCRQKFKAANLCIE